MLNLDVCTNIATVLKSKSNQFNMHYDGNIYYCHGNMHQSIFWSGMILNMHFKIWSQALILAYACQAGHILIYSLLQEKHRNSANLKQKSK